MRILPEARAIVERLVAFRTVSHDSNRDLIHWVADYLRSHGITPVIVPNADGTKAGLYAQTGPDAPGGVVLSAHTDVVPVDGQDWTTDPWVLTERDGRLYGRGTTDMKGFAALALAAMGQARRLQRPLQIAFSWDEELGCLGAPDLITQMVSHGMTRAQSVIVGEPSLMQVVTGHKGVFAYNVAVRGHEVHSALVTQGVSAVMEGARLITWAADRNLELATGPLSRAFHPPHSTLHTGVIRGGTATNITARDCVFDLEVRTVPGDPVSGWQARITAEATRISAAMQAVQPGTGITLTFDYDVPPLAPEVDGPAEALARRLTGDNGTHVVSYATEAGQFQAAGYSAVVCGPGDIAQAHQQDEYLSVAQFTAGAGFMERLLAELRG